MVSGIILSLIAVAAGILGPTVIPNIIKDGIENYHEIRRVQQFDCADPVETWIRPWLVFQPNVMLSAEQPEQRRPRSLVFGPRSTRNTQRLPTGELRAVLAVHDEAFGNVGLALPYAVEEAA